MKNRCSGGIHSGCLPYTNINKRVFAVIQERLEKLMVLTLPEIYQNKTFIQYALIIRPIIILIIGRIIISKVKSDLINHPARIGLTPHPHKVASIGP